MFAKWVSSATLCITPFTTQPYASFPSGASSNQLEIVYGYNSGVQQMTAIAGSLTEYTLTNLQFEQEYSISIRVRVGYSRSHTFTEIILMKSVLELWNQVKT